MKTKRIQVFEHQSLKIGNTYNDITFTTQYFNALVKFNELHKNKYFTVGYKKITFKQYVGALQVNNIVIEILPKVDNTTRQKDVWQHVLIAMLKATKNIKVKKVGDAYVNKQNIHLLTIYFEWFLNELQVLVNQGLIKQYYKESKNTKALKGKLEFAGHLQQNLIHKERFYTTHQVYEKNHLVHQVLAKALIVIESLTKGTALYYSCKKLQLHFTDVTNIRVTEATFNKITYNRKNATYKTALEIARFIILNYSPNITRGKEKMFALLFNMNSLWESYILVQLKKVAAQQNNVTVFGKSSKVFWGSNKLYPDIVIKKDERTYIIDTKWKCPENKTASAADLRQMYAYCRFWNAERALLLYPGKDKGNRFVNYQTEEYLINGNTMKHQCKMGFVSVLNEIGKLSDNIGFDVLEKL